MRIVVGFVLLGCGAPAFRYPPSQLDAAIATGLGSVAHFDCGQLGIQKGSTSDLQDAHDCVEHARLAARPFSVSWYLAGIDSDIQRGFYARFEHDDLVVYQLGYDSLDVTGTCPHVARCTKLVPARGCRELSAELCFECVVPTRVDHCTPRAPGDG